MSFSHVSDEEFLHRGYYIAAAIGVLVSFKKNSYSDLAQRISKHNGFSRRFSKDEAMRFVRGFVLHHESIQTFTPQPLVEKEEELRELMSKLPPLVKTPAAKPKKVKRKKKKRLSARRREYNEYIGSSEWQTFRRKIFKERGKFCEECGETEGELHIHHLHYKNFKNELPEDVKILCKTCHGKVHGQKF